MASVADKGVSPRTVDHCRAVLRNALNHAMRHSLLFRNVAALAVAPNVPEPEIRAITPAAARHVLAAVRGDRLEALFTVALACGLRQSEALGLRWSDIDLDTATLRVQRTIQRVNGEYQILEPKTKRSRRTISLPAPVATSLRQHKARQTEDRLRVGSAWEGDAWGGLVFTDEDGSPLSSYHVGRRFKSLLAVAGLQSMRYHDLRHGAASLMAAQGVPARVAMQVLGHAQISTTMNIYAHIAPEFQKEASERVAAALWPGA
jgi:integrase